MRFYDSKPNYALICIGVVFLSFSFVGQALFNQSNEQLIRPNISLAKKQQNEFNQPQSLATLETPFSNIFTDSQSPIALSAAYATEVSASDLKIEEHEPLILTDKALTGEKDNAFIETSIARKHDKENIKTYNYQIARNLRAVTASSNSNDSNKVQKAIRTIAINDLPKEEPVLVLMETTSREAPKIHNIIIKALVNDSILATDIDSNNAKTLRVDSAEQEILSSIYSKKETPNKEIIFEDEQKSIDYQKEIVSFLKELYLQDKPTKISVLSKMTPQEIIKVKEILNAHNISLRAFVKNSTKKGS